MNTITKGLVGTVAAGAMAVASASPALARGHDGGVSAGDVIAGALVIGGIAAIASAASNNDHYGYNEVRYDGRGYDGGYGGYGYRANPRQATEMCVNAATRQAARYSYGGRAQVTDIRSVNRNRDGYTVKGRIAVNTAGRNWRSGDGYYGRGWGGDYRGWNSNLRGYDSGTFKCQVKYGRVTDIDFSGIRGL